MSDLPRPAGIRTGRQEPEDEVVAERLAESEARKMAFVEMEHKENEAIVKGITGAELGDFLYSIPFKYEYGVVDCKSPGCKYKDKGIKHIHQTGVGVAGIDEVARVYEGIQAFVIGHKKIHKDGRYFIRATAMAQDIYTGNMRTAIAEQPCTKKRAADDPRASFDEIIAGRKATRNAIKQILPQVLLAKLLSWAHEGKRTFDADDAQRLIDSLGASRRNREPKFFISGVDASMRMIANDEPAALPAPQKAIKIAHKVEPTPAYASSRQEDIPSEPKDDGWDHGEDNTPVVGFGQYKGKTVLQIYQENEGYVKYLASSASDVNIKSAAANLLDMEPDKPQSLLDAAKRAGLDEATLQEIVLQNYGVKMVDMRPEDVAYMVQEFEKQA